METDFPNPTMRDLLDTNMPTPLFVYGTLRVGGRLHDHWIKPAVLDHEPATAYGHALYLSPTVTFPFMVPEEGRYTMGDVLWVNPSHPAVLETVRMETAVLYTWRLIDVETASCTIPLRAMSFVWEQRPARSWTRLDSGDFQFQPNLRLV